MCIIWNIFFFFLGQHFHRQTAGNCGWPYHRPMLERDIQRGQWQAQSMWLRRSPSVVTCTYHPKIYMQTINCSFNINLTEFCTNFFLSAFSIPRQMSRKGKMLGKKDAWLFFVHQESGNSCGFLADFFPCHSFSQKFLQNPYVASKLEL